MKPKKNSHRSLQVIGHGFLWIVLSGCTPTLNWRTVTTQDANVQLLMPCKPDQATREIMLGNEPHIMHVDLKMQGCEAGNMQFTLSEMTLTNHKASTNAVDLWRLASLAPLKATTSEIKDAETSIQSVGNEAKAKRTIVRREDQQAQFLWFKKDEKIYQAAVYAKASNKDFAETAESYFSGIKLQ